MKKENNIKNNKEEDLYEELLQLSIDLMTKAIPSMIYHYTSMEALFNVILCRGNDESKICLRACNALYMNDPNEIQFGFSFLGKSDNSDNLKENDCNVYIEMSSHCFLTSFSSQRDYLPMWNIYARNATGIALGFNSDIIKKHKETELLSCLYDHDILKSILDKYDDENIKEKNTDNLTAVAIGILLFCLFLPILSEKDKKPLIDCINSTLSPIFTLAVSLKNSSYSYEQEVRLLSVADKEEDVQFYFKNNYFIPYINHYFPKEALEEIIVGPNNDMGRTIYSIKTYLKYIGFEHVKVIPSNVPYRG